ncbi:hypothetical protein PCANC_10758 [Puccinia coronata f. sp. avenae]|uniref:DUF659 domain-containing protein n=1 Tax=Puccinia coronata f. sp. avenae TaxID=200324 RepID=A0A2N5VSQ5_9BASI|nr:hypothetical protein PCANC_10758 [Puccinia coronata f. sp. avenae]
MASNRKKNKRTTSSNSSPQPRIQDDSQPQGINPLVTPTSTQPPSETNHGESEAIELLDASHKAILHPTIIKSLPRRLTVSKDIHMIYLAVQHEYKSVLEAHNGVLYLGFDAWQSPNGFDILGVVIYWLADDNSGNPKLEAVPLDFICLAQSHTGDYLAQKVTLVVEKFEIQHKICGIVSDNASNNKAMVKYFKLAHWEPEWISEAIRLARDMWLSIYKPSPVAPSLALAATVVHKPKTGTLAGLGEAAAAQGGNCLTDLLDIWLAGALILNDNEPVNPLKWWLQQKRIGNTHGGLLQMALDVLSCPGGCTSSTLTLAW